MESMPFVSVVTPFFNTAEFLAECIESVLRQTYDNWEYVLIDNQSTDGSDEIAKSYARHFPDKIRIIRTESFLPQVQNYNFALTCMSPTSKYCKMVQADDWLFPDCVRSMVEVAELHPTVGIVSAYELEGSHVNLDGLPYSATEVPGPEVCRLFFMKGMYLFGTPTSLLLRSDLVRSRVPFYEERYAPFEDGHVCFDLLRTSNFGFVHQVLTFTRRDNESLISPMLSFRFELFVRLWMLMEHGHDYLSVDEYDSCLYNAEHEYFLYLARCALQGRSKEFWEFHRSKLASLNYVLDWKLLRPWMPSAVLSEAADMYPPKRAGDFVPIEPIARMKLAVKVFRQLRRVKWHTDRQIGSAREF